MPRCPAVFKRKRKERNYDDPWDGHSASKENYRSMKGHVEKLRQQFREEKDIYSRNGGMMLDVSLHDV